MKKLLTSLALAVFIVIAGCADSSSPSENPYVSIIGELETPYVNMIETIKNDNQMLENEVDSIKIVRIRILMSRMMLFLENDISTVGAVIKTEPFIYDYSLSSGSTVLGNHDVPAGIYEKIKIEIHRFNSNEMTQYANDPNFMDFATSDRHTILIEGITYKDENPSTFVFKSNAVANLMMKFEPSLNLKDNSSTTLVVYMDPNFFFKKWESILDPNDPKNMNDIENTLINTFKAKRK